MDDDYRELASRLFATATAMLEDATKAAGAGQSPRLDPSALAEAGHQLEATAREIATIAQAAAIVANLSRNPRGNRRKSSR